MLSKTSCFTKAKPLTLSMPTDYIEYDKTTAEKYNVLKYWIRGARSSYATINDIFCNHFFK